MSRLFCFGLGYTAAVLARSLVDAGWTIAGTAREEAGCARLRDAGYDSWRFGRGQPLPARALAGATHVLLSIPPHAAGDPALERHGAALAALPELRWVGYLSTTGVYGDRAGGWVDESSALRPSGERGGRRVAAEAGWQALLPGLPLHIFRLPGIYGPGRNALAAVRAGRAQRIDKPGQVFSRIHVEDLAAVLRASMARPDPGRVYNVCDDEAAPAEAVIAFGCTLLGVPPPPLVAFDAAPLTAMARSFYADSKRVANARIKAELGIRLRYPSYRDGLRALFASGA